ncbi:hypothetical protein GYMLUDRAFT_884739 [Collybiopsis luxurians FD-317 M1]|uniref:Uncharacterized protein n=1 Tax=Collybiopsis luxurians FD-317 M1 TaxID=944289 RepID=A0A0D0CAV0_9AGAR|nr:hypothetical protein GYMLUDRAFT_884739 [Collybiopsis luxurians FD-317 M1]
MFFYHIRDFNGTLGKLIFNTVVTRSGEGSSRCCASCRGDTSSPTFDNSRFHKSLAIRNAFWGPMYNPDWLTCIQDKTFSSNIAKGCSPEGLLSPLESKRSMHNSTLVNSPPSVECSSISTRNCPCSYSSSSYCLTSFPFLLTRCLANTLQTG